jgi:cytochrome P450
MPKPKLPGPTSFPEALLTTIRFQRDNVSVLEWGRRKYGDMWTLRLVAGPTLHICSDPELFRLALEGDPEVLHTASDLVAKPVVGDQSVLVVNEGAHRAARKLLEPYFRLERMQPYREHVERISDEELSRLQVGEQVELLHLL